MDFVSSEKKESSEVIESDAILNGMHFCLELFAAEFNFRSLINGTPKRCVPSGKTTRNSKLSTENSTTVLEDSQ